MEEIKVGEYVRNNRGIIGKVTGIFDRHSLAKYQVTFQVGVKVKRQYLSNKTIVKHSPNIIDLIEEGDYVNGYKVAEVKEVPNKEIGKVVRYDDEFIGGYDWWFYEEPRNEDIKSIITKEQIESIKYEV